MENKPNSNLAKLIAGLIILILIVTFSIQNNEDTPVKFWFWTANSPRILIFLTCFLAGVFFAMLAIAPIYKHSRRKSKLIEEMKDRIDMLEKQISGNK